METKVCSRCNGTGVESAEAAGGEQYKQFCPDCLAGNTLALQAAGSKLDPAKYPACQFEPGNKMGFSSCDDTGTLQNGISCDCDKASILGFEGYGCSHDVAIKVMCALSSCDYGCSDPVRVLVDLIDEAHNASPENEVVAVGITKAVQENPEAVQLSLDSCYLRRYL